MTKDEEFERWLVGEYPRLAAFFGPASGEPSPVRRQAEAEICRGCDFYRAWDSRCCLPTDVAGRRHCSSDRINPWLHLPKCPIGRWSAALLPSPGSAPAGPSQP